MAAPRATFGRDLGLQVRMLLTMALLGLLYVVQTTGRPSAPASALMKLSRGMERVPDRDLRAAGELNAFFIVPARAKGALRSLLSTHPPMERRIAALARLEADLQRPAPGARRGVTARAP